MLEEDCPNWMVPISICTSEDPSCTKIKVLLDQPETTVNVTNVATDQWVKVRLLCFLYFIEKAIYTSNWDDSKINNPSHERVKRGHIMENGITKTVA